MEMRKLTNTVLSNDYNDFIFDLINLAVEKFSIVYKSSIINYDNWKVNCDKEEYLKNPEYKIYELKNRNSPNSVVANVKWKFNYDDKLLRDKATIIYLGSVVKYPGISNDIQLNKDIHDIIKNHFILKSPFFKVDTVNLSKMLDEVELYYYWKNKLVELEYRKNPIFYLSQSKNNKPEQVIINIKWGFEVPNKQTKPRYILKRFTIDKRYIDNLNDESLKQELNSIVKTHINKAIPVFFNPFKKNHL